MHHLVYDNRTKILQKERLIMSEIERFNKDVREVKELQEEIKKIGNDLEKIVAFANSKGYVITIADIEALVKENGGGELLEDDLDDVAGGGGAAITITGVAIVYILGVV